MSRGLLRILLASVCVAGCEIAFPAGELSTEARGEGPGSGVAGSGGSAAASGGGGEGGEAGNAGTGGAGGQGGASGSHAAGFPTTECNPGDVMTVGVCDLCGKLRKHCTASGEYGTAVCEDQGECEPGATDSGACGNCGKHSRTCSTSCTWGAYGACGGQGACKPGDTQQGGCDPCSQQVCKNDCSWGGCGLKPGSECEWKNGMEFQCCGSGHWQFCAGPGASNACHWYSCAACTSCGC